MSATTNRPPPCLSNAQRLGVEASSEFRIIEFLGAQKNLLDHALHART
jgi:hypothetical protein